MQKPAVTVVEHPQVPFELPGAWERKASDDYLEYVCVEFNEQVIVDTLEGPLSVDAAQAKIRKLASMRRELIAEKSGGTARVSKPRELDECIGVLFGGVDPKSQVQAFVQIVGFPERIVTLSHYRYDLNDPNGFGQRASIALGNFVVASVFHLQDT